MPERPHNEPEGERFEELREQTEETSGTDTQHVVYEDGFTRRTMVGALFVAFVMLPGAIYLGLVSGQSLGSASEWVTIVLFAEIARRSFIPLKRQEIYVLFYIAAALSGLNAAIGVSGGPFGNLIWNGYLHIAPQATGQPVTIDGEITTISRAIPSWAIPPEGSTVWTQRTFFHWDWLIPIALLILGAVVDKISQITGGYALFRLTSDIERLPFPMAPVHAAGATALAEAGSKEESWRWRVFSIGAMAGVVFGFFYLGIPIFTGTVLPAPLKLLPLPFWDATANTEGILPGAATGLSFDLTNVLVGFVLPFPMVVGAAITSVLSQVLVNPFLYYNGLLPTYRKGANALWTKMATDLDFWMSVDIGLKVAVALIGIWMAAGILTRYLRGRRAVNTGAAPDAFASAAPPPGRGDWDWKKGLVLFFICQAVFVGMGAALVPAFPLVILIALAFLYTPLISYVSARMYGLTGQGVGLPYLREAIFIRTGYKGIDVWFMPMPMHDYGYFAQRFREVELTGTKFTSIIKAEVLVLPLIMVASFIYWAFLWYTSAIPSSQFPYAQMYWPVHVTYRVLWMSATTEGGKAVEQFLRAIRPEVIGASCAVGLVSYGAMTLLKLPVLFFYGAVGGVGQMMIGTVPHLIGALLGRYYFATRFGLHDWRKYAPVLLAGFSCGMGLIAMCAIALGLITKSVSFLPF
jgi:hypothetical protein